MVSVLDSGTEGPGVKIAATTLLGNSLRQTVHTHCASVHQAAKLVEALFSVAGVTAGLAESNSSLPLGLWLTSPAGWLLRTGNSSGTLRSVIKYGLPFLHSDKATNHSIMSLSSSVCLFLPGKDRNAPLIHSHPGLAREFSVGEIECLFLFKHQLQRSQPPTCRWNQVHWTYTC